MFGITAEEANERREACSKGETCTLCGEPAATKVEEETWGEHRHPLTAYVCGLCFERIMMPYKHGRPLQFDDPALDATDAAHQAWWRGQDFAAAQFQQRLEAERAKVKRLELRLVMARADVLEHRLLKRIRRYRERMGVAVDEEDLRYWLNKRDRAHERIMLINRIALKAEKELANVDR